MSEDLLQYIKWPMGELNKPGENLSHFPPSLNWYIFEKYWIKKHFQRQSSCLIAHNPIITLQW